MKKSQHPSSPRPLPKKLSRREALKAAGLGLAGIGGAGCLGPMPTRCQAGPTDPTLQSGGEADGAPTTRQLMGTFDHLVVVLMENRSFDHLFSGLALDADYVAAGKIARVMDRAVNTAPDGTFVPMTLMKGSGTLNPLHNWLASRETFNGGLNDGFVKVNPGANQSEVMAYLGRDQLPFTYALANEGTVCDRWFSSVMGPTWPNRFYVHATTSNGVKKNQPMGLSGPATIWERMADSCWSAKNYFAGAIPWYSVAYPAKSSSGNDAMVPEPMDAFFRDAQSGNLPNFSLIDPDFQLNDGHPPHDLSLAEAFLSSVHRALAAGPKWSRTLLVITFDEHGGFYDSVPPPLTADPIDEFRQLGFRVPAIVTGPMARKGAVVSTQFEHCSIAATLGARFGIQSLGTRMDASADFSSCIDPAAIAAATTTTAARAAPLPTVRLGRALAHHDAFHVTSQPELHRLARQGRVPLHHLDPRPPAERMQAWLRHAQDLEAVRVMA